MPLSNQPGSSLRALLHIARTSLGLLLALGTSAFALSEADSARLGLLAAQDARPLLITRSQGEGFKYVHGEAGFDAHFVTLLKNHAEMLERSAAYAYVTSDQTMDPELFTLSLRLRAIRLTQVNSISGIKIPDAGSDLVNYIGRSMAIGIMTKDKKEADELRGRAFLDQLSSHLTDQANLKKNMETFVQGENEAQTAWADFKRSHADLEQESRFTSPLKDLVAEHDRRGKEALATLNASPKAFHDTLLGQRSKRLNWLFDKTDTALTLTVNEQKTSGIVIMSDVTMLIRGASGEEKTIRLKTAHFVSRFKDINVLTVN